jgi:glutamate racemase
MTRLLVFDSGVGGLSVAREIRRALPSVEMIYVADDAGFPYGERGNAELTARVLGLMEGLVRRFRPDSVVIACNTASTLVLPPLRARFDVPVVGTVPAIKPAAERTRSGLISVLATPGTMQRDYTRGLIESYAGHCTVRLVGSADLAPLAEAFMRGELVDDAAIHREIAPAFVEQDGRRTDIVVLACTHYAFLKDRFENLAPWPVAWLDPAPAIARRVVSVLGDAPGGTGAGAAYLTSGGPWPETLGGVLAATGLRPVAPSHLAKGDGLSAAASTIGIGHPLRDQVPDQPDGEPRQPDEPDAPVDPE